MSAVYPCTAGSGYFAFDLPMENTRTMYCSAWLYGDDTYQDALHHIVLAEGTELPGEVAFKLHDTYGFPIELTLEMAAEQGVKVDEAKFRELMAEQKSRARADALKKRHNVDLSVYDDFKKTLVSPIDFLGYTDMSARAKVIGIMQEGKGSVPAVTGPANVEVILDRTPFYAAASSPTRARSCPTTAPCSKSTMCRSPSRTSSSTSAV